MCNRDSLQIEDTQCSRVSPVLFPLASLKFCKFLVVVLDIYIASAFSLNNHTKKIIFQVELKCILYLYADSGKKVLFPQYL